MIWLAAGQQRFLKWGLLVFITYFFLDKTLVLHSFSEKLTQIPLKQVLKCQPNIVTPLNPDGAVGQKWQYLERRFKRYRPEQQLEPKDFKDGQVAKPSIAMLSEFLNMTALDAKIMREKHVRFVEELPEYPEREYRGRGIVLTCGGKYSEYASTTIGMLRLIGSQLPIEVWLKDAIEEKQGWCDELAEDGISCRHLDDYIEDLSAFTHPYQYKIAAMFFSSFEEVMFLDSDSIPVKNPDPIFDSPVYQDTGMILWSDYWDSTESPWVPFITGQKRFKSRAVPNIITVDSGQMVWDKKRHWKVVHQSSCTLNMALMAKITHQTLCLSAYYNYHGPSYFYTLITQGGPGWGDKDTFPTASRALNLSFTQVPHRLQTQFLNRGDDHGTGSGIAMLQADPWNRTAFQPLFLHSNLIKLSARRLMCLTCEEFPSALTMEQRRAGQEVRFEGQVQMRDHSTHNALNHWKRIFAIKTDEGLNHMGVLDTERDIWRVLERQACVGVWSERRLCQRTRRHLRLTFGVKESWKRQRAGCKSRGGK